MESGAVFAAKCVTFDQKRRTGGDVLEILEASLLQRDEKEAPAAAGRPLTRREEVLKSVGRKANHKAHYTRNVRLHCAGEPTHTIIKIHPPLLIEFNGKIVVP